MSSDNEAVRELLRILSQKITESPELMKSQNIGNALYGLQNMSCDSIEVRLVLSALSKKIRECKEVLSGQELGNALYGLQR